MTANPKPALYLSIAIDLETLLPLTAAYRFTNGDARPFDGEVHVPKDVLEGLKAAHLDEMAQRKKLQIQIKEREVRAMRDKNKPEKKTPDHQLSLFEEEAPCT